MSEAARCALYLRSSKDRHDVSIDAQRRELLELAAAKSLAVAAEYADAVEAANDWSRPAFRRLLADVGRADRGWQTLLVLDTSRLARDVHLAGVFRHECRRRGVRVLFAKIPQIDPLSDVITTHVYQLVDHIHSHMSREKGLAGMAENVRQGFRAGGRAPVGYRLEAVQTGAVREGAPVTKSRLVPDPELAPKVATYLKARARGRSIPAAAAAAGLEIPRSSLAYVDRRALVYAGHTVWNQSRGRALGAGGYEGGTKKRPRAEWIVQRGTHDPLIAEAEAEAILAGLARRAGIRTRGDAYLLSGLLVTPDGARWHGDQGFYRCVGRRVKAEALERQVLEALGRELASDAIVRQTARLAREAVKPDARQAELRVLQRQAADLERKIGRVRNLLPEMKHPEALLPKLEELQAEKAAVAERAAAIAGELEGARVQALVTEEDVRAVLANLVESLIGMPRAQLKAHLRGLLERIVLAPESLSCCLHYAIPAATGFSVASPRRAGAIPMLRLHRRLALVGFRRVA